MPEASSAISILHSLGILALMSIGISMLQPSRFSTASTWWRTVLIGMIFGATISFVMIDPVRLPQGATLDARGGPALLAGVYGGPVAAVIAAVVGSATRLWIGGAGGPGGVVGFAIYAVVGIAARWYLLRNGTRPTFAWFFGLGVIGTICVVPSFFVYPDWRIGITILERAGWMVISSNVVGVLVLGSLLEQDWRRRRLEEDLRETEAESRAAADAKTRFLASMSHEIRTPMNAVVGFVDLLRDSNLDGFQRRCSDQIRDAAQGLLRIIDDILDFAKIDSGRVTLDPQPTDVAALVRGCREMLLPQIESKRIACTLDLPDRLPAAVDADPIRLRQILLNLLGNAVKFTDTGRIAVAVLYVPDPDGGRGTLTITIADTGIGMTPEEFDRLFSPFVQGDHVGRGGTGLGLVISRMLVQAMGGELGLHSSPGAGTTVTVRLPVAEASPPAVAATPAGPPADAETSLQILVAEDVELNAEMLQATLEQAGHAVHVVSDGQMAIDAVRRFPFDIVLMDVQMPVMDGLEATRAIRALDGPAGTVPIIALTAYASRDDLRMCLEAGMNDFLTKPLERTKLLEALQRYGGRGQRIVALPIVPATASASDRASGPSAAIPAANSAANSAGESVDRVGELLSQLVETDRDDREAVRTMADNLVAAAGNVGFDALAERARRLVAASVRSNAEALSALIEDVADAGRRSLDTARQTGRGEGR